MKQKKSKNSSILAVTGFYRLLLSNIILSFAIFSYGQDCGCQDCPLPIPAGAGVYEMEYVVRGIVNDDLSNPNQRVCQVDIRFEHERLQNLEIFLISPSGEDTVQLIGPFTGFGFGLGTPNTTWDVGFVDCFPNDNASHPNHPELSDEWDNADPGWSTFFGGNFTGNFFPTNGNCLSELDSGPVNGTWKLRIVNNVPPSINAGRIFDFKVTMCDETGLDCCFANGGNLAGPAQLLACERSEELLLAQNLIRPTYSGSRPDTEDYGYTYLIVENGNIIAQQEQPDLRSFNPGQYVIKGLSYNKDELPLPIATDGSLTLIELADTLDDVQALFCGSLSTDEILLTITSPPDVVVIDTSICQGDTFRIGNSTFFEANTYTKTIPAANGVCDSTIQIILSVIPRDTTELSATICNGESYAVGNETFSASGRHTVRIPSAVGCDSLVVLHLTVLSELVTTIDTLICAGRSVTIGEQSYTTDGVYEIPLVSSNGCDSMVILDLSVRQLQAVINPATPVITCSNPVVTLNGSVSSSGPNVSYSWSTANGNIVSGNTEALAMADAPGTYTLLVRDTQLGCETSRTATVTENLSFPIANAGMPDTITCTNSGIQLDPSASTGGAELSFNWLSPDGTPLTGSNPLATAAGAYTLIVTRDDNGCTDTASVEIAANQEVPEVILPDTVDISCSTGTVMLDGSGSSQGPQYDYDWSTLNGSIIGGIQTPTAQANRTGVYTLFVTDNRTGCTGSADIVVVENCSPTAIISASTDTINCYNPVVELSGQNAPVGNAFTYAWRNEAGEIMDTALITEIRNSGTYIFEVTNTLFNTVSRDTITITEDLLPPSANAGSPFTLTCTDNQGTLDGSSSSQGDQFSYLWTTPNGNITAGNTTLQPLIDAAGVYILEVINTSNGCIARDSVTISADANAPSICFDNTVTIFPCRQDTLLLNAACPNTPIGLTYSWTTTDGQILTGAQTAAIVIDRAGIYQLQVDNPSNGCSTTRNLTVQWENCAVLISPAVSDILTCDREEVSLTATITPQSDNYVFTWTTSGGNIIGNPNEINTTVNAPGTYFLTAVDTLRGSENTSSIVVEQNITLPTVDAGVADSLTCRTTSVVLNGSGSSNLTYQWTANNGQVIENSTILQAVVREPGMYYLEATDRITGCSAIDSVEVIQNVESPIADAGINMELTCNITTVNLNASNSSFGANFSYNWRSIGGRIESGVNTLTPEVSAAGMYILTVTNEDTGCLASDTIFVAANKQLPQIDAGEDDQLTCDNPEIQLNGAGPAGADFEIIWTLVGNPAIQFEDNYQPTIDQPGIYELQVTNTTTGCTSTQTVEIIDNSGGFTLEIPQPELISCGPTGVQLATITSPASEDYFYEWQSVNGDTIANPNTATATVFTPGAYSVLVTNTATGCMATATTLVELNGVLPTAFAGPDTTLTCTRTSVQLRGRSDLQTVNFQWTDRLGNALASTASFSVQTPGSYILTVRNPQNNCSTRDTVQVLEDTVAPTALIENENGSTITCDQPQLILDGSNSQPSGNVRYRWTNASATNLGNMSQIQVNIPGTYFLQVTNLANGCVNLDTLQVTQNTTPPTIAIATPPLVPCSASTVQLDASGSSQENIQFVWTNATGDTISTNLNPSVSAGTYRLFATNTLTGCAASQSITVMNATPPSAKATNLTGSDLDCNTSMVELSASGSATGNNIQYTWLATDKSTVIGSESSVTLDEPGLYFLQVTDNSTSCVTLDSIFVEEDGNAIQDVSLTIMSATCSDAKGGSIRINNIIGGTEPILLSWNERPFYPVNAIERLEGGAYNLILQDAQGCEWDTTVIVELPPVLEVDLGPDQFITVGDSVLLEPLANQKLLSVTWTATDTLSCTDCFKQIVHPMRETTYTVFVEDENGCTAKDVVTIRVDRNQLLYMPNAFSPNSDGNNDVFFLSARQSAVEEIELLQIFDRWGMLVFQQQNFQPNDPTFGWNGSFEGTTLNPAVFVYHARVRYADGRTEVVEGDVALVR